ncbi:hypothetical protein KY289_026420 [Solanum tuberosum]|nr:hypothetical protein KY289_026420 [Solanum tuberosum]
MGSNIDYNNSLYLHPSDALGSLSIEIQLKGMEKYMLWSQAMKLALLGRNKLGFIDGSVTRNIYEGDLQRRWDRCNAIVVSWLMSSVQSDLLSGILFRSDAYLVWNDFKERFDKARSQILMMSPEPSVNQAYAMIIQDKSQKMPVGEKDATTMYLTIGSGPGQSSGSGGHQYQKKDCDFYNMKGHTRVDCYKLQKCEHCLQKGHVKETCYKLIGYPKNFKGKKRANVATQPLAGLNLGYIHGLQAIEHGVGVGLAPALTQNQYNLIVQMLNKCSISDTGISFSHIDDSAKWVVDIGATNHMIGDKSVVQTGTSVDDAGKDLSSGKVREIVQREVDAALWHKRMGHAPMSVLRRIPAFQNKSCFIIDKCDICPLARQTRVHFPVSVTKSSRLFELLHMDVWGPYKTVTTDERRHRHILETARALKFQGCLPDRFWGICIEAVVYIINRIPSIVLDKKTPYELIYHKVPELKHMRVIGCLCYATNLVKQDKFGPRAIGVVMMEMSTFNAHVFPFENKLAHLDIRNQVTSPVSVDDFDSFFDVESMISSVRQSTDDAIQSTGDVVQRNVDVDVQESVDDVIVPIEQNVAPFHYANDRRSHGSIRPPLWHKDFVMTNNKISCQYPISNVVSYTGLSVQYKDFLCNFSFSTITEPGSYSEAVKVPQWIDAMKTKINALEDNKT